MIDLLPDRDRVRSRLRAAWALTDADLAEQRLQLLAGELDRTWPDAADATAIFAPDQVPAEPPASYARATIHYLDSRSRRVNVLAPGGRIATTEYDAKDNPVRELSAANRERALGGGPSAQLLDVERVYSADGLDLLSETGPQHEVRLPDGSLVQARRRTEHTYSDHLATRTKTSAGGTADVRETQTEYNMTVRKPTAVKVDPGGLNLISRTGYDSSTGLETERRQPKSNGSDAGARLTLYYTAGSHPSDGDCSNHAEWANLVCKTKPAAQPGTAGLPDLPVTRYEYDRLGQTTKASETTGSATRTTTTTYDAIGRKTSESVTASAGTALPSVDYAYHASNGRLATSATTEAGATRTVSRAYDTLGRVTSYTDADGATSTTGYDLLGRVSSTSDGKGSQTLSYDATTGDLTGVSDSHAGVFGASYDADGQLLTKSYPGGLVAQTTYDAAGQATGLTYTKTTNCASNCIWLSFDQKRNAHGQVTVDNASSLYGRVFRYDQAARLVETRDTPAAGSCTVRSYILDANSNRTALESRAPALLSTACNPTGAPTTTTSTYDAADRQTDAGLIYDAFGRITSTPAARAGGQILTAGYYANDLARSLAQNGETHTYELDPERRLRRHLTSGGDGQTRVSHYPDDTDEPAWQTQTTDGLRWTRNIEGPAGGLDAIHDSQTGTTLQITSLHGDTVANVPASPTATGIAQLMRTDEFGIPQPIASPLLGGPTPGAARGYRYLGSHQRSTDLNTGTILMGARAYLPQAGRFLQTDPVVGGSASAYDYAEQDPINQLDLAGTCVLKKVPFVGKKVCKVLKGAFRVGRVVLKYGVGPYCFVKHILIKKYNPHHGYWWNVLHHTKAFVVCNLPS